MNFCKSLLLTIGLIGGLPVEAQDTPDVEQDSAALKAYYSERQTDYEAAVYSLSDYASARHKENTPTAVLSEIYHQIALAYSPWAPVITLSYLDTTRILRFYTPGVSLTQKARTVFLQAEKYSELEAHGRAANRLSEAIALLDEALIKEPEEEKNHYRYNYIYVLAGHTAYNNGDLALAKFYLERAKENIEKYPSPTDRLAATNALASVYYDEGNRSEAIDLYLTLLDEIDPGDDASLAIGFMNLARMYSIDGDSAKAEINFLKSLNYNRAKVRVDDNVTARKNYVDLYANWLEHDLRYNNVERVPQRLEEITAVRPDGEDNQVSSIIGEAYLFLASGFTERGEFARADSLLTIAQQAVLIPGSAEDGALPTVSKSIKASRPDEVFQLLEAYQQRHLAAYNVNGDAADLELAKLASRKIDTLIRSGRQDLNLTGSLRPFIRRERGYYGGAVGLALQSYGTTRSKADLWEAYRFAASSKAALLKRFLGINSVALSYGVSQEEIDEKTALEVRQLVLERQLIAAGEAGDAAIRDSLLAVNTRNSQLRERLFKDFPGLKAGLSEGIGFSEEEARSALPNDLLLVEYFLVDDIIHLFALSGENGLQYAEIARPSDLSELVANQFKDATTSRRLYDLLIAPALKLAPAATLRIQFIPDTDLWPVSFAAVTNPDGQVLIEEYAVSYAYSADLAVNPESFQSALADKENEYLGFGISYESILSNLNGSGGNRSARDRDLRNMGSLPYARDEVERSAKLISGRAYLDEEATKANFLDQAGDATILHLAMHGILEDNPMETALIFAGREGESYAPLTMREIMEKRFTNALTVLSACHTGGGPVESSEGMQSIGRAFMAAGSAATITSNWEANDRATHDILLAFYDRLESGAPKDVAMQGAIKTYLAASTAAERQPIRWANLVVNGSLQPLASTGLPSLVWWALALVGGLLLLFLFRKVVT